MRIVDLDKITLLKGQHSPDSQYCVMELAAYIAEEKWSDHPISVSPIIGIFLRCWNDSLDDETRQQLKPYAIKVINTQGTKKQELERTWMAIDWLVREYTPAFLRLAGLTAHADVLTNLAALTESSYTRDAQAKIDAAWAAARDAAGEDAAKAAARDAAGAAAWAAAWAATWAAAREDAAGDAAGKKLEPAVKIVQASAFLLLNRMIAITGKLDS